MATKKKTKKRVLMPRKGLLNWPPSRGPMPDVMKRQPKYIVPDLVIEAVEWVADKKNYKVPAKPIERIETPLAPKPSAKEIAERKRGIYRTSLFRDGLNAQREFDFNLFYSVTDVAALKPWQWDLLGGAVVRPRGRGGKSHASMEKMLPERALTFDIIYPMQRIARVTIAPYTYVGGYSGKKSKQMSVGYVLWQLAQAYRRIYKTWKTWGIWGHAIGDLAFERLTISDNIGYVSIGS